MPAAAILLGGAVRHGEDLRFEQKPCSRHAPQNLHPYLQYPIIDLRKIIQAAKYNRTPLRRQVCRRRRGTQRLPTKMRPRQHEQTLDKALLRMSRRKYGIREKIIHGL